MKDAPESDLVATLSGGDRRSIGRANEVADRVGDLASAAAQLLLAIEGDDPVVRLRAADALEKASAKSPSILEPLKGDLLRLLKDHPQMEVRWHLIQMTPRLCLGQRERQEAVELLMGHLGDKSAIVRADALSALTEFARRDGDLRAQWEPALNRFTHDGAAAVRARARKLMRTLARDEDDPASHSSSSHDSS